MGSRLRPGDLAAMFELLEQADLVLPMAIRLVCDLRVADLIQRDGPSTAATLADGCGADARSLERLLRALASREIFEETDGRFGLTPRAELLRSDHPLSLARAYPLLRGDVRAFGRLDHSIRTGESAFKHVHGVDYWPWMAAHPEQARRLDGAQEAQTRLEVRILLRALSWADFGEIVDVGGGNGALLAGLLRRVPGLRGHLVDSPHVVEAAGPAFARAGVADRVEIQAGSFFDPLPRGAGAYLLKRVLYGWLDPEASRLLAGVRAAMAPASRLLIMEPLQGPDCNDAGRRYDLMLLALSGTGARTLEHIDTLLEGAGLERVDLVETMLYPVIIAKRSAPPDPTGGSTMSR
jgi:hypothetical protein